MSLKDLVHSRVECDPAFSAALLREGADVMLSCDVDSEKAILRDYIKATVQKQAGVQLDISPEVD